MIQYLLLPHLPFLSFPSLPPPLSLQYFSLLQQLATIFHMLGVWQVDPLLHGEVSLKLGCLREASADLRHSKQGETLAGVCVQVWMWRVGVIMSPPAKTALFLFPPPFSPPSREGFCDSV